MIRNVVFQTEGFYHVYNRGTEKRKIFTSKQDYERFILLLYVANSKEPIHLNNHRGLTSVELLKLERGELLVDICAYCLMPNHFHLLVRERDEVGLSRFMQKILTGYTMYFNTRHERTGALFQGTFKAQDANDDRYLKYLISYIHLNPIKLIEPFWKETGIHNGKGAEKYLEKYQYSSYLDYCGNDRPEHSIINTSNLPEYFETPRDFKTFIANWLEYRTQNPDSTEV